MSFESGVYEPNQNNFDQNEDDNIGSQDLFHEDLSTSLMESNENESNANIESMDLFSPNESLKKSTDETIETTNVGASAQEKSTADKLVHLPLSRIKHIMKMDPDVHMASHEAVFVVTKATELFIESLTRETYAYTVRGKKKTIQRRDLDAAIEAVDTLCFLEGAID